MKCTHELCDHEAQRHILLQERDRLIMVQACTEHTSAGRRLGRLVAEHAMGPICGLPGALWEAELNVCLEITEEGVDVTGAKGHRTMTRGGSDGPDEDGNGSR